MVSVTKRTSANDYGEVVIKDGETVLSSVVPSTTTAAAKGDHELEAKDDEGVGLLQQQDSSSNNIIPPDLTFPGRLYLLLKHAEENHKKFGSVMSWTQNGTAFQVHNRIEFELNLLPKYFKMSKYKNFTRQLRAYGFTCCYNQKQQQQKLLPSYSHPNFKWNDPRGCYNITRKTTTKTKEKTNTNTTNSLSSNNNTNVLTAASGTGNNNIMMHSTCTGEFKPGNIECNLHPVYNRQQQHWSHHKEEEEQQKQAIYQQQQLQVANVTSPNNTAAMTQLQLQLQQQHQTIPMESKTIKSCVSPSSNGDEDGGGNGNSSGNSSRVVMLLEPRRIEEMVADAGDPLEPLPIWWYDWCPTMTPTQQAKMEYSLPVVLPAMFYALNLSPFGVGSCIFLVLGHTIETMVTNFGSMATDYTFCPLIGPVKHHLMDSIWIHALVSAMLLFPQYFGNAAAGGDDGDSDRTIGFVTGLSLIPTHPIYLSVSFKTHFTSNILPRLHHVHQQKKKKKEKILMKTATTTSTIKEEKQKSLCFMGNMIRNYFLWYYTSLLFCFVGEYYFDGHFNTIKIMSIFLLNMIPLMNARSYIYQFVTKEYLTTTYTQSERKKRI